MTGPSVNGQQIRQLRQHNFWIQPNDVFSDRQGIDACRSPPLWAMAASCRSPPLWAMAVSCGSPPLWAMGVAHALDLTLQTIAHRGSS